MIVKPILDSGLMESIESAIVMWRHKDQWSKWGMDRLRQQGSAMLFYGPTGTGKTISAHWIAHELGMKLKQIDFGDFGSKTPGQLARNIKALFVGATAAEDSPLPDDLVLLDECDSFLVSRHLLGGDTLWMQEPINQMLVSIRRFKGLVILATNRLPDYLDPALDSRLLGKFGFDRPREQLTSINLWKQKWSSKLPIKPTDTFLKLASKFCYTGAEIETFLIKWVSDAIKESPENPTLNIKTLELLISEKQ